MIQPLKERTRFQNEKVTKCYTKFSDLIDELRSRSLSNDTTTVINKEINLINEKPDEKELKKQVRKSQHIIIKKLEKEHKIVPKGYYRTTWMAIGMSAFGIPMGAAFGAALGNMAMIGMGIPIGMAIGITVGSQKDAQAAKDGRQLNFVWG